MTGKIIDLSISKHIQCCAADGCEVCSTDLEHAALAGIQGPPNDDFTAYMQNKSDDHHQALFERHGIESPSFTRTPSPAQLAAQDEMQAAQARYLQVSGGATNTNTVPGGQE